MRIGIPVSDNCIATVLDFSDTMVVLLVKNGAVIERSVITFAEKTTLGIARQIEELGIEVILCGALSRAMEFMISGRGIRVLPNLRGPVHEVLGAFFSGNLSQPCFSLPGCHNRRTRGRKRFRGKNPLGLTPLNK